MRAKMDKFKSGWVGLSFALRPTEIDQLTSMLSRLKNRDVGHFHFRNDDFSSQEGVADVEFSVMDEAERDNLKIE